MTKLIAWSEGLVKARWARAVVRLKDLKSEVTSGVDSSSDASLFVGFAMQAVGVAPKLPLHSCHDATRGKGACHGEQAHRMV